MIKIVLMQEQSGGSNHRTAQATWWGDI